MDSNRTTDQRNPGGAYGYAFYMRWLMLNSACEHEWEVITGRLDGDGEHYLDYCPKCSLYRHREIPGARLAW